MALAHRGGGYVNVIDDHAVVFLKGIQHNLVQSIFQRQGVAAVRALHEILDPQKHTPETAVQMCQNRALAASGF